MVRGFSGVAEKAPHHEGEECCRRPVANSEPQSPHAEVQDRVTRELASKHPVPTQQAHDEIIWAMPHSHKQSGLPSCVLTSP
jgi:hypothetical protein